MEALFAAPAARKSLTRRHRANTAPLHGFTRGRSRTLRSRPASAVRVRPPELHRKPKVSTFDFSGFKVEARTPASSLAGRVRTGSLYTTSQLGLIISSRPLRKKDACRASRHSPPSRRFLPACRGTRSLTQSFLAWRGRGSGFAAGAMCVLLAPAA